MLLRQVIGSSLNIKQVMDPWLYQMGFPVVTIITRSNFVLDATQTRFLIDPSNDPTQPPSPYGQVLCRFPLLPLTEFNCHYFLSSRFILTKCD